MLLDIIFALILGYGFYLGFSEKVINTFALGILIILALLLSINLAPIIADFLAPILKIDGGLVFFISMLISFFIGVIIIRMLITWMKGLVSTDDVNIAAKLGSGLVMGSILLLLYGVGIGTADKLDAIDRSMKKQSITYHFTKDFPTVVKRGLTSVSPAAKEFWAHVSGGVEDNYRKSERRNKRRRE